MGLRGVGCCCGAVKCRCPGCIYCRDNKSPRALIVKLHDLGNLNESPCNTDCDWLVWEDEEKTIRRSYRFEATSIDDEDRCIWRFLGSIEVDEACGDGNLEIVGTFEIILGDDPGEYVATVTFEVETLGTFVFKKNIVGDELTELIDCNTNDVDDNTLADDQSDGYVIDETESETIYCDIDEAWAEVAVVKCTVPCCNPCECCGPVFGTEGRHITKIEIWLPPATICGDQDCGGGGAGPVQCCPSIIRAYNSLFTEQWLEIPVSAFSQCADENYTVEFPYDAEEGDPTFGVDTFGCWNCAAGTAILTLEFDILSANEDECAISIVGNVNSGDYFVIGITEIIAAKPLDCGEGEEDVPTDPPYTTTQEFAPCQEPTAPCSGEVQIRIYSRNCQKVLECNSVCLPTSTPETITVQIDSENACAGLNGDQYTLDKINNCEDELAEEECEDGCCWRYEGVYDSKPFILTACIVKEFNPADSGGRNNLAFYIILNFPDDDVKIVKQYLLTGVDIDTIPQNCEASLDPATVNGGMTYLAQPPHPTCGMVGFNVVSVE